MSDHILSAGEQAMRNRAQAALQAGANLLNEPLKREEVRAALKQARAAAAALEYLESRAVGIPAPKWEPD